MERYDYRSSLILHCIRYGSLLKMATPIQKICLLTCVKTGVGKSTLVNSLLNKPAACSGGPGSSICSSLSAVTKIVHIEKLAVKRITRYSVIA